MDKTLKERLVILQQAGQIDDATVKSIEKFIKLIEEKLNIKVTEENGSMFVTHIAMAISRLKNGEEIAPLDDLLLSELKGTRIYPKIPSLIKELEERLKINIPESEYGYIALHLANLGNTKN